MGMIGAIRFARRDTDEGEVKRMAFGQMEGIGLAAEGDEIPLMVLAYFRRAIGVALREHERY